jgi:hypothetical protein
LSQIATRRSISDLVPFPDFDRKFHFGPQSICGSYAQRACADLALAEPLTLILAPEVIRVSHFHLKYFRRTGQGQTNYSAVFYSQIDALSAAGLANATRGQDPGYYGIEECQRSSCEKPHQQPAAASKKRRPARKGFPPPSEMLH